MKINLENTYPKSYLEILPSMVIRWKAGAFYFGWLFWSVFIEF